MILDLAAVHFTPASLHAAWTARIAHFLEYVDLMPDFAPAFEAYARLAGEILTSSLVTHTHPGKGLDALHVHPCVGGCVDLDECLTVRWTGEAGAPFAITYTRQGESQAIPLDAADLDRAFLAFLPQYFPAERFATGAYPSPRILTSPARRFIGVGWETSLVQPVIDLLWRTLMPLRTAIP